jgi:hypothetical protein
MPSKNTQYVPGSAMLYSSTEQKKSLDWFRSTFAEVRDGQSSIRVTFVSMRVFGEQVERKTYTGSNARIK